MSASMASSISVLTGGIKSLFLLKSIIPTYRQASIWQISHKGVGTLRKGFHSSCIRRDLMEFFDEKKNWGETTVKVGRAWRLEELRIKSNSDLHKLWYILLKEKNMLLTMQHASKEECEYFPNPERIDKVEESMANLEAIVKERNQAYHELEVGEYREVPKPDRSTPFRHLFWRDVKEYPIPKAMNEEWHKEQVHFTMKESRWFVQKMARKIHDDKIKAIRRQHNHVVKLLKRFPDADEEAIKAHFPDVDLVEVKRKLE